MKIKTEERVKLGYRQGYKVYINGKKFPSKWGFFYTHLTEKAAIKAAVEHYREEVITYRENHGGNHASITQEEKRRLKNFLF